MEANARSSAAARTARYLKAHPVLTLLILTPGIPEYITSSSPLNAIVLNPSQFVFQLVANLGLYGSGALLIHDAGIRWGKGWGSVLLLGLAYGILEEGIALSTLFNPQAGPIGSLGVYGRWLGVNWIWAAQIVPFHAIFSISIPILLLGFAIPETRETPLLTRRRTAAVLAILAFDVAILMAIVWRTTGYWMGLPILTLSLLSVAGLAVASHRIPAEAHRSSTATSPPRTRMVLAGASFFPAVVLAESLGEGSGIPAILDFVLVLGVQSLYLVYLARVDWSDEQRTVAFVLGLLIPLAVFGVLAELAFPMTLLADVALFLFIRWLWRSRRPAGSLPLTVS